MSEPDRAPASALVLALDGALGAFSAALIARDESIAPRGAVAAGQDALERGLTIVDDVLAGVALAEIGTLAVGTGPGSFTGLRIALSYAKSLAFAARLPLIGVSSYDAVAPSDVAGTHAAFVHGRVGIACARLRVGERVERERTVREHVVSGSYAVIADIFATVLPPGTVLPCYGASEGAAGALAERGITVLSVAPQPPIPALAVARRALVATAAERPHALRADYGEAHYAERAPHAAEPRPAEPRP